VIDYQGRAYLWGVLHDKNVNENLCLKIPERINSL
jgi:hypothetical protein